MKKGKIIDHENGENALLRNSLFSVVFDNKEFGPYSYIYDRERLYFDEGLQERGSYFFPLKEKVFNNTEMFIERSDIVLAVGSRGSFSGESKQFLEVINLKTAAKYRFYPEEVSLIYNAKDSIVLYYKKSGVGKKLSLEINSLEKISEKKHEVSAFFKLIFDHNSKLYSRLIYKANSRSHKAGYFIEEHMKHQKNPINKMNNHRIGRKILDNITHENDSIPNHNFNVGDSKRYDYSPLAFTRDSFSLKTSNGEKIDIWEASLTGKLI